MKSMDEKAVSEVIGVVLLISVTVLGVALVAVTYFSQPAPSEIPHVSVVAGVTADNATFVLLHEGGDALTEGNYRIYVDSGSGLENQTDKFALEGDDDVWSIGENLTYKGTPGRVVISVVDSGGGEIMIAEPAYVAGAVDAGGYVDEGGSGTVPVVTVTPGEETPFSSPIVITYPSIEGPIKWNKDVNYTATVDANATRVDLVVYDFSETSWNKVRVYTMENTTPEIYYKVLGIAGHTAESGHDVSITVIAYNETEVIGYDTIIVKTIN